jgi:hypothetical protein
MVDELISDVDAGADDDPVCFDSVCCDPHPLKINRTPANTITDTTHLRAIFIPNSSNDY